MPNDAIVAFPLRYVNSNCNNIFNVVRKIALRTPLRKLVHGKHLCSTTSFDSLQIVQRFNFSSPQIYYTFVCPCSLYQSLVRAHDKRT